MVANKSTVAIAAVARSAREPSIAVAVSDGWAIRRRRIKRPRSSIARPRWAATRAEYSPCSTVNPPSTAWARTKAAATTVPRTSQRRSRNRR
jgi:hypothetical protein